MLPNGLTIGNIAPTTSNVFAASSLSPLLTEHPSYGATGGRECAVGPVGLPEIRLGLHQQQCHGLGEHPTGRCRRPRHLLEGRIRPLSAKNPKRLLSHLPSVSGACSRPGWDNKIQMIVP